MSRRLVLWRHGLTDWNVQGRLQGQSDVPLNEVGEQQARDAGARLAALAPARIVSSDLVRARETARALADLVGLEVETDERLREMNFGEREGLTMEETVARFPDQVATFMSDDDVRMPGAELYVEAAERFATGLDEIVAAMGEDDTTVVVAHGAVLRVGICSFLGFPRQTWRSFGGFNNCSWTVLEQLRGRWRIAEWNAGTLPEPVLSDDR
ncbi:histidine phosphatase family protein [Solicola sp. PLA-1-18]|uniref:histidine phosphatase family protein n=1 Tax=Solicola sp. PLA-1-18 TaxID=3380532 RepID=UPI003B7A5D80